MAFRIEIYAYILASFRLRYIRLAPISINKTADEIGAP